MRSMLPPALILASAFFTGCASNYGSTQIQDFGRFTQLERHETDKREVYELFGQPHDVHYLESDESVWTYFHARSQMSGATLIPFIGLVAGGNNYDVDIANFYFDPADKYTKVETTTKSQYVNQWVGIGTVGVKKVMRKAVSKTK